MTLNLSQFEYQLPPELIATHPAAERSGSRLFHLRRDGAPFEHRRFSDLPELLREGDCLVFNDSKVIPARLHARRPGGGVTELMILDPVAPGVWEAMVRPARKLQTGMRLTLPGGAGEAEILEGGGERTRHVRFHLATESQDLIEFLEKHGEMPLPPYILHQRKEQGEAGTETSDDRERYQTVYAQPPGSVAAPTAGLHFTPELLERLRERGVELRRVTLHVGIGTFEPVTVSDVTTHKMHTERYSIDAENAAAIEAARRDPARRVVAVGTTTVRTLEACFAKFGEIRPAQESTNIFIYPGYQFGVVGAMTTNFHLPGSTLMLLVAAFAGTERILAAYAEAIREKYRFYSYGDAMLIE
jgi:S-adenosylmethionine:tRNA ribosyltransferase-isomerase